MTKPSVLFVGEAGESPSAYYRCTLPALGLRKHGWDAMHANFVWPNRHGEMVVSETSTDVVVLRRLLDADNKSVSNRGMIRAAIKAGQRVYIDLDDDAWHVPEHNPAHGTMTAQELSWWEGDMRAATGVIVSTPTLANVVHDMVKVERSRIHVCRNPIALDNYKPNRDERQPIRLAWLGMTPFRLKDFEVAAEALETVLSDPPAPVEFWHLGWRQSDPQLPKFPVRTRMQPWVDIQSLPYALRQIDVAIVPMELSTFNLSRSNVTGLALMAAGIPFAASSHIPEYLDLWTKGGGYMVFNTTEVWADAIRALIDPAHREFRNDVRNAGLALVRHFSPEKMAEHYVKAFTA